MGEHSTVDAPGPAIVERPNLIVRVWRAFASATEWLFGVACVLVFLAALASFPLLSFLSLGYLLEVSGRVARSGRFRDGFVGVRKAARIGGLLLGTWLLIWPLRLISDFWYSSHLIDPSSAATRGWRFALMAGTLLMVLHIVSAWLRGGRLRSFFWPRPIDCCRRVFGGGAWRTSRDAVWEFVASLQLPHFFSLGVRGFAGGMIWLALPILLLVSAVFVPVPLGVLLGFLGFVSLSIVLLYLPFLQAHFAAENRFAAMFELRSMRNAFVRAPIAFWFALFITLLFALPLYLLKIELTPKEATWLPGLAFSLFIAPARLLTGWALGRARRRAEPRFFLFRWVARFAELPIVASYVGIVYLTRYVNWYGSASLFEQHAFLLPIPFLSL